MSNADIIHLNDEDFEKHFDAEFNKLISGNQEEEKQEEQQIQEESNDSEEEEQEVEQEEKNNSEESSEEDSESTEDKKEGSDESKNENQEEEKEKTETQSTINYEEEYKKLLAPFKANGSEMKVNNIEEAITLMQKGANYHHKMNSIKPIMRIAKMLENNSLLNESDVQFLIDLKKHDPDAIAKLISDAKIDPVTIDPDRKQQYKPGNDRVTDSELQFEEVMNDIKTSSAYSRTIQVISNYDDASKLSLAENPNLIANLNYQIEIGLFDKINTEVTRRQILGSLPKNLSALDAYIQVGDELDKAGAFKEFEDKVRQPNVNKQEEKPTGKKAPLKNVDNDELKAKKQAVAPNKGTTTKEKDLKDFNPLSMTDEEFEKQFGKILR